MDKKELETKVGRLYNTEEVQAKYQIEGFMAPFCYAIERETKRKCLLAFQHEPRFYWFDSYIINE